MRDQARVPSVAGSKQVAASSLFRKGIVFSPDPLLAARRVRNLAGSALGLGAGTPSPFVIQCAILGLVVFHCNVYSFLLHFLYSGVLPRMGLQCGRIPRLVARVAR